MTRWLMLPAFAVVLSPFLKIFSHKDTTIVYSSLFGLALALLSKIVYGALLENVGKLMVLFEQFIIIPCRKQSLFKLFE